jgi:hypothetical protein
MLIPLQSVTSQLHEPLQFAMLTAYKTITIPTENSYMKGHIYEEPTRGGRSVDIVRSRTQATEFFGGEMTPCSLVPFRIIGFLDFAHRPGF